MVRMIEEDTRFGVGSYKYLSDSIHSIEDAMQWLCRLRDVGPYKVEYIRLEDIDGNENDTTTRISADATAEEICDCIEGKEIGRVALVGKYMGSGCRISIYLKGYTIQLFLDTLDPLVRDKMVELFQKTLEKN